MSSTPVARLLATTLPILFTDALWCNV